MAGVALPLQNEVLGVYALCFKFIDFVIAGVGCLPSIALGKNKGIKNIFKFRPMSPSPEPWKTQTGLFLPQKHSSLVQREQ